MTLSKIPIKITFSGIFFIPFLLLASWGNVLLAKPPPRAHYLNDTQYVVMKVRAASELTAVDHWAPALSGDQPPFQDVALGSPKPPPEALWLTQDLSLTVASGACAVGSINLCAVIVGINDPKIRIWAKDICGLPIFWNLKPNAETNDWSNGRILDLKTLQDRPLNVTFKSDLLILRVSDQAPIYWHETTVSPVGCGS